MCSSPPVVVALRIRGSGLMKAGRILKLAGNNYISGLAEHHREVAAKQLNVILDAAETFNAELAAVGDDTTLSAKGRIEESRKVAAAALARLAAVESTTIRTLTERAASLEQSLLKKTTPPPPKDAAERMAYELRLQEVRNQLRELPAADRLNLYRTTTDPTMLAAIETATMALSAARPDGTRRLEPFVDAEQMTAAKLERAEQADPATAATLREVKSLREVYSHALNSVRAEIMDEVPVVAV
jgi:hypothetical protein